jgi:hypothetical protein
LASDEAIRISCGGKDFATEGFTWSRDRFFLGGELYYLADLDALYAGRDEAALYQTERYFFADQETELGKLAVGYRIPLPSGKYRVSLHFVEGHWKERGKRVFDVLLNRETEISNYEPLAVGFGKVDILERDVRVEDRVLRVDFRRIEENPKISAFEIRRMR